MGFAPGYSLRIAESREDMESFARLAVAYQQWLGVDLCFQGFEQELAGLPGCYSSPGGLILLVSHALPSQGHKDIACVAVRPLHTNSTAASCNSAADQLPSAEQYTPSTRCNSTQHSHSRHDDHASDKVIQHEATSGTQTAPGCNDVSSACEMKRLWVCKDHQNCGLGKALIMAAVEKAREFGYKTMLLDTLETLEAANRLYGALGFVQRGCYYHNPLPGVVYWQLDL